jgi:hypothetical protein
MTFKVQALSYGIRFNTYMFPLRISELANDLEKKGYEISPDLPSPVPTVALGGAGPIARKGKTLIHVDTREQVLTIIDVSAKSALDCFDEITGMLKEGHKINLDNLIGVYEFNAQCEVPTQKQAYENIAKNVKVPILDKIEGILEKQLWPSGLRFGGAEMKFNSTNWFEFSIEPNFTRNDSYFININYRNGKKEESRSFTESFEEKIDRIIELIDK